ncbi:unnamed protein product [Lepeophtheirus salmonis]|uniref:(salmon louse) hypothetical protein n=1 Tax=Lepeophtheirus salmonis TaxID=72036 RepID=A0A7R8CKB1_LEPSM|nr:unnamed protein product [Lepeophtheirus salmonis]CAF2846601.1 unnamed protein product [Lepeophtheirus salmonis]
MGMLEIMTRDISCECMTDTNQRIYVEVLPEEEVTSKGSSDIDQFIKRKINFFPTPANLPVELDPMESSPTGEDSKDDNDNQFIVLIMPPENEENTNKDSGSEEETNMWNLPRSQLISNAECNKADFSSYRNCKSTDQLHPTELSQT